MRASFLTFFLSGEADMFLHKNNKTLLSGELIHFEGI